MEKKIIFVQLGARFDYAIPKILEDSGILEAFYTDICSDVGLGKTLKKYFPRHLSLQKLENLARRETQLGAKNKIVTFPEVALRQYLQDVVSKLTKFSANEQLSDLVFGRAMVQHGVGKATHVFSMFGEGSEFLKYAKEKGLTTIVDVYIVPQAASIIQQERNSFPDLEPLKVPENIVRSERLRKVCQFTDYYTVPSKFVGEGLEKLGVSSEQYFILPYAISDSWLDIVNDPLPGRILFVGTAELRKGIHYLGMAANKLNGFKALDFRVVGGVSDNILNHDLMKNLNFLGRIPRFEVQKEYERADIFVLPTLAEGSASAVYEALAAGLPVITTEAAGSVVRHGIEGFIIPERNSELLANYILELYRNRELRQNMSKAARDRAKKFTWESYSHSLMRILKNI